MTTLETSRTISGFASAAAIICLGAPLAMAAPAPQGSSQVPQARRAPRVEVYQTTDSKVPFLGVNIQEVNDDRAGELSLSEARGAEITSVVDGTAAAKAGLRKGDVVLEYNGTRLEGPEQFIRLVRETPVGRGFALQASRDGEVKTLTGTMGSRKGAFIKLKKGGKEHLIEFPDFDVPDIRIPDIPHLSTNWRSSKLGVVTESVSGEFAEYFGVEEGVLVRSVAEDSPAKRAGVKAGDVITEVNETSVESPREITSAMRELESREFEIRVMRERKELALLVSLDTPEE